MLVGYSSSSSEEEEEEDSEAAAATQCQSCSPKKKEKEGFPMPKKAKMEECVSKTRLPLPDCLQTMFLDEEDPQTEDSSLHGGRIRTFKHERETGPHMFIFHVNHPEEEFEELLEELLSAAASHGVDLTAQEEFHLSLSQTVVLRHHWIQPFMQSLRAGLTHCKRFVCSAGRLRVYCNAERTRTFLSMEVLTGHAQLLDLVRVIDQTLTEFQLETFYKDPSFHVSLAWCVGDLTEELKEITKELQSLVDERDDGPFLLYLDVAELRCRTGNKTFRFPLET